MKRKYIFMTLLFILMSLGLLACNTDGEDTPDGEPTTIPAVVETSRSVSAEAFLFPISEANIAFETNGRVVEVLVKEGEQVEAGQVLVRLNDSDAKAAIAVAEASLAQAQANLASAKTGPRAEQIAVAEAAITQAEANLAATMIGASAEDIAVAEARVDTLRAQLSQILSGSRSESVRASLANVKQAEIVLANAQREYDKIAYAADSDQAIPIVQALQSASLSHEAALANHEALVNGATGWEINVALAQIAEGEAGVTQLEVGPKAEQIAVAQAGVLQAEASLEQAKLGPTTEQIAVAEAGVEQAEAALAQTQLVLDRLEIKASMDAMVISLNVETGEYVSPGIAVVSLADLSTWQLETDDLTEIDVVKVTEGQKVDVRFDSLPNETFAATVTRIKPRSETKAGDVTYTVVIVLDNADSRLRWGMTAFVEIKAE